MKRKAHTKSPWGKRKTPDGKLIFVWVAAALLVGAVIGLLWPSSLLPGKPPGATGQPTVIYNPAPPTSKRADSPTPLPPAGGFGASTADAPAVRASFGFCAGRSGTNCVIDGDTFIIGGQTIRLASIDTPEIGGARCPDERRRGMAAEERLHQLLNEGPVQMVTAGDRDRDRYGRLLRDAHVNGRSVSGQLVAEGHARRWSGAKESWC